MSVFLLLVAFFRVGVNANWKRSTYAAGGDVWQGATQAAIGGALGGFTRGFYLNRFAQVCFVAGGPLVMNFDGNSTPTEEIQVGEFVLARSEFDPASPLELKRVEEKSV